MLIALDDVWLDDIQGRGFPRTLLQLLSRSLMSLAKGVHLRKNDRQKSCHNSSRDIFVCNTNS